MESESPQFDWVGWLTSIPGIPTGWGEAPTAGKYHAIFQAPDMFGAPDGAGITERKAA